MHNAEGVTLGGDLAIAATALFNKINWGTIGTTFAEGLNGIVDAIDTFVCMTDWGVLGRGIADMLIKAIEGMDLADLGRTLAHTINAAITTYDAFEEEMGPWFMVFGQNLADGINTAVENIDWAGVGETLSMRFLTDAISGFLQDLNYSGIGESIGTAFDSWFNNIDWDAIAFSISTGWNGTIGIIDGFINETNWGEYGTKIANILNQIINGINWDEFGATLGKSLQSAISYMFNFVKELDWYAMGEDVATTATNFFSEVDWAQMFNMLGETISGFSDILTGFFQNVDWIAAGNGLMEALENIDFAGVFDHFCEALGSAFGGLAAFLISFICAELDNITEWWNEHAFEDGEFSFAKFFGGLLEGLGDLYQWIDDHIFRPFIDGLCRAFGVESPSKETEEVGGYISEGLLNGVLAPFKAIGDWLNEHIFTPFMDGLKSLFNTHSPSKVTEELGGYIAEGLLNGIKDPFGTIKNWLSDHVS